MSNYVSGFVVLEIGSLVGKITRFGRSIPRLTDIVKKFSEFPGGSLEFLWKEYSLVMGTGFLASQYGR